MKFSKYIKERIIGVPKGAPEGATEINFAELREILLPDKSNEIPKEYKENITYKPSTFTVKNLKIILPPKNCPVPYSIYFSESIEFISNTFLCSEKKSEDSIIFVNLNNQGNFDFKHNIFENIKLSFGSIDKISAINEEGKPYDSYGNYYYLDKDVKLKNNKISAIQCPAHARVHFQRYNEINKLDIFEAQEKTSKLNIFEPQVRSSGLSIFEEQEEDKKNIDDRFGVRWTPYQKIDLEKNHTTINRASFIVLKERAVRKGDKLQESILQREILKCESVLFESENDNALRQDRWIMSFGKWISGHGVFWLRPFYCLLVINLTLALIAFWIAWASPISWNFVEVFFEMFNPLSSLADTMMPLVVCDNVAISIINVFQKPILAVLIYELIRVGRRFT